MDFTIIDRHGREWDAPDGKINADILHNCGGSLKIAARIQIVDMTALWHPALLTLPPVKLPEKAEFDCGKDAAFPMFIFMNQMSHVSWAIALSDFCDPVHAAAQMIPQQGCYEVCFTIDVTPQSSPFEIFTDQSKCSLSEVLQRYRTLTMPVRPEYPECAWLSDSEHLSAAPGEKIRKFSLNALSGSALFQAVDAPFDYIENFSRLVQLRLLLGDNVPIYSAPVQFNNSESVESVGRYMIAALAGIPQVDIVREELTFEQQKTVQNYLDFYCRYQQLFSRGSWFAEIRSGFTAWLKCSWQNQAVIIITDEALLELALHDCPEHAVVLNLTPGRLIHCSGKAYDAQGLPCDNIAPVGGRLEITSKK
ncbi:MAG: hypothetical protein E7052_08610 [Lentisphaerae bacterium]|nr:hypothetical protein [Lentisphaerota bacterium]